MKRFISLLLFLILFSTSLYSQDCNINLKAKVVKAFAGLSVGDEIVITRIREYSYKYDDKTYYYYYLLTEDNQRIRFDGNNQLDDYFDFVVEKPRELWNHKFLTKAIPSFEPSVSLSSIRYDLTIDSKTALQQILGSGVELSDPLLTSYIQSLIRKIYPDEYLDSTKHEVGVVLVRNSTPNAYCLPNGVIVINSGLLACLHNEAELVAILTHELAHYLLSHAESNIIAEINRQQRAAFFSSLATLATAVAELSITSHNNHYLPGLMTMTVAAMSEPIVEEVTEYLGMKYNHEQEDEADELAREMLTLLGYDSSAMSSALTRFVQYYESLGMHWYVNDSSDTHPSIASRLQTNGNPILTVDTSFEKMVSLAVSSTALLEANDMNFHQSISLVNQNINNGIATCDDYLIKANSLIAIKGGEIAYKDLIFNSINEAKQINKNNINVYRTEINAYLAYRLYDEAIVLINAYTERLLELNQKGQLGVLYASYINDELVWANNMLAHIKGLCQ